MQVALAARQLPGEELGQLGAVVQTGETVGDGEGLQLLVSDAQFMVDRDILVPELAQLSDHLIEDLRQVADLAVAMERQVHLQVPPGDLSRAVGQAA